MANGHGGRRNGAGRPVGTGGRSRRTLADLALSESIAKGLTDHLPEHIRFMTPRDLMLAAMRITAGRYEETRKIDDLYMAVKFAKEAAPYEHAKLQNIQMEHDFASRIEGLSDTELAALASGSTEDITRLN